MMILGIWSSFRDLAVNVVGAVNVMGKASGEASAKKAVPLREGVRGGAGASPRTPREETSGTTATFEHAVIRRGDAGDGTLLSVAVWPVDVCENQHCA
jgi:hypothetical protein